MLFKEKRMLFKEKRMLFKEKRASTDFDRFYWHVEMHKKDKGYAFWNTPETVGFKNIGTAFHGKHTHTFLGTAFLPLAITWVAQL